MATLTLREKRIKARKMGINNARELDEDELDEAIAGNGSRSKSTARKAVSKVVKKRGPGRPRKVVDEDEDDEPAPRRRGRPKGSTNKSTTVKRGPGRPRSTTTKTTTSKKRTGAVGRPVGSGTGTRVLVPERIKWNKSFAFRDGTTNQYVLDALQKAAGKYDDTADIREEAFERLEAKLGKVDQLTFIDRSTGKKKTGEKAIQYLRFLVNRVIYLFCVETGQHDGTPTTTRTRTSSKATTTVKRGRGRPRKVVDDEDDEEEAPRRRGRPPGTKNKSTTTVKRGPGRPRKTPAAEAPRRRGRPPGSKNKATPSSTTSRGRGRPRRS